MTIRYKTIIIFGLSFALLIGAVIYATNFFVQNNFIALEDRNARYTMELYRQELRHRLDFMHMTTMDWGTWEPTYQFVTTLDQEYVSKNLTPYFLNYSKINFVLILNPEGDIIFTLYHELPQSFVSVEELVKPRLKQFPLIFGHLLGVKPQLTYSTGFLYFDDHPVIVSGHQLLKTDLTGPSRGILIMGYILDSDSALEPAESQQVVATITPAPQQTLIGEPLAVADISPFSTNITVKRTEQHISSQVILTCLDRDQLLLTVTSTRDLFMTSRRTTDLYNMAIILLGLAFGITSLLFMERVVLTPLTRFTRSVLKIGRGEYFQARLSGQSSDEIGQLAGSINKMLEALADYQQEKDARQFQDLVECSLVATMIVVRNRVVYQNHIQREICGDLPAHFSIYNFLALNVDPRD